jgi:hypothetical protein
MVSEMVFGIDRMERSIGAQSSEGQRMGGGAGACISHAQTTIRSIGCELLMQVLCKSLVFEPVASVWIKVVFGR